MEIGFVGLGRMGGNMSLRLLKKGHRVIGFDLSSQAVQSYASKGTVPAKDWADFVKQFQSKPRVMWVMVPAGAPTTDAIDKLA
ncbi:MAG TPA: NAD(P)-binding domain-containing protein, partial [Candidatus Dormibacteraeota bacterium]|nr:NAD(P)-binding domain-containing protein [Candidatus Dormibacteraeota bacterium]